MSAGFVEARALVWGWRGAARNCAVAGTAGSTMIYDPPGRPRAGRRSGAKFRVGRLSDRSVQAGEAASCKARLKRHSDRTGADAVVVVADAGKLSKLYAILRYRRPVGRSRSKPVPSPRSAGTDR